MDETFKQWATRSIKEMIHDGYFWTLILLIGVPIPILIVGRLFYIWWLVVISLIWIFCGLFIVVISHMYYTSRKTLN